MKKRLRLVFIFALLITLVACGDRETPTFDDILDQTINVGSDAQNWEDLLENLADNETPVDRLVITVEDNVNYDVPGTYEVMIEVSDENNNKALAIFNVTVVDNVKPIITLVGQASVSLIVGESFTDPGATFTDNVDGTGNATVSGSVNAAVAGTYTLTYSYTDAAGNTADPVTRTVTVIPLDTQNPVITLTGDAVLTVEAGATFTDPGATFTDNLDGTGAAIASGSVDTSALGSYTLTYTYTDAQGNAATPVTRTVNVVDTTAPVITVAQASYTVEVGSTFSLPTATASDNLDSDASVSATGSVDANTVGTYTLTFTHSDSEGNAATAVTVTVNVVDTTAPEITLNGEATITVEAGSIYSELGANATDNYDASATVVVSGTVNNGALGTYTLTYTSTDASGNVGTATRTVNVVDTTAPTITVSGGLSATVQINETFTVPTATFSDNLDATGTVTSSGTVDTATVGTYTITYTATDTSGNTNTVDLIVTVSDTPPRLAQFAPVEDDVFVISRYFRFNTIEIFLLNYSSKSLLVIFEGNDVLTQIEYGLQPTGPSSETSLNVFQNAYLVSENGILLQSRNFSNGEQKVELFNLQTKTIDNTLPQGSLEFRFTGPNQEPTIPLVEYKKYAYLVLEGDDRGVYTFNADLTLNKILILQQDFSNGYLEFIDSNFMLLNFSSYGETTVRLSALFDVVNGEMIQTYNENIYNYFYLGDKLVINYYDNSLNNGNSNVMQVWSSPDSSDMYAEFNSNYYPFYTEESNESMTWPRVATHLAVIYNDFGNGEKQLRFYDETFTRTSLHVMSQYTYSFDKVEDYIVILDRPQGEIPTLKAYHYDGTVITADYTTDALYQNGFSYYLDTSNYELMRPFGQFYILYGSDGMNNVVDKVLFYFMNGQFYSHTLNTALDIRSGRSYFNEDNSGFIFTLSAVENNNNEFLSKVAIASIDFDSETLTITNEATINDNIYNSSNTTVISGSYALFASSEAQEYSTYKYFVLFDLVNNTAVSAEVDEAIQASWIQDLIIEEGVVKIVFNMSTLESSLTSFGNPFTTGQAGPGGGSSVYLIENILNDDDLKIEMAFDPETGPAINVYINDVLVLNQSVVNPSYQVYVYDGEGTENDTIFMYFRQLGYAIDLNDPLLSKIYGALTAEGYLSIDENYNETFGVIPILPEMYLEHWMYRI